MNKSKVRKNLLSFEITEFHCNEFHVKISSDHLFTEEMYVLISREIFK